MSAEEFMSDKTYACKLYLKKYPLKRDRSNHVFGLKEHLEYLQNRWEVNLECAYCDHNYEESTDRKRHYNNLECSYIICGTCSKQPNNNQSFVDHLYTKHIKKIPCLKPIQLRTKMRKIYRAPQMTRSPC